MSSSEAAPSDHLGSTANSAHLAARALPPAYLLRRAKPSDTRAVGRILSDWIDATDWMPRIHTRIEDRLHAGRLIGEMEVSVICRRRRLLPPQVVGFLGRRAHFVHALYLAPKARGLGLGSALLSAAKREAGHLELWCFQANHAARAFYQAQGFVPVEFGDGSGNDEGLLDLRLSWSQE